MPVALLPPTTSSCGAWSGQLPLLEAPRYARGRGNGRWHRIRSAVVYPAASWRPDGWTAYTYWCGVHGTDGGKAGPLWLVDDVPASEPVCGTCVGRALGAGQDDVPAGLPSLLFSPRWRTPPAVCPGSRSRTLWTQVSRNCGQCLVCGDITPIRVVGSGYNAWGAGPINHAPGVQLVEPCPFHAWINLVERGGRAVCGCGWPGETS
jgi:hypothetical protein